MDSATPHSIHYETSGKQPGRLVVSLDFELYWGMRHLQTISRYFPNLVGARKAIPALLALFEEYGIHATWATVGFLFFERTDALRKAAPQRQPSYQNAKLSPYLDLPPEELEESPESIFFAPSLIRMIRKAPNQEIATHTFSHYYCREEGSDIETFRQDLLSAHAAARKFDVTLKSLVFPQNECRDDFLGVCADLGIVAYRGNPLSWFHCDLPQEEHGYARRMARLLDAYLPFSSVCHPIGAWDGTLPVNIPSSQFLRPCTPRLGWVERLRLQRIKRDLTFAAKKGQLYHLWWHPHNFGVNTFANLAFLQKILRHFQYLKRRYGMESLSMGESAERLIQSRKMAGAANAGDDHNAAPGEP
jgi:peptidoglycan/xylan/chitin deacetylase (PgdA/CDA1 family)